MKQPDLIPEAGRSSRGVLPVALTAAVVLLGALAYFNAGGAGEWSRPFRTDAAGATATTPSPSPRPVAGDATGNAAARRPRLGEPGSLDGFNVLLVTVDTLRADALTTYGGKPGLTPNIDRLATEGVRFDAAFAHATMTLPSHASILTGTFPTRHGVRDNGVYRLAETNVTLAETLGGAGYRTGAFVGSFVLDIRFGLGQGFDRYDDFYGEDRGSRDFHFLERRAAEVIGPAAAWIEEGEETWFAWVHLFDPHVPYAPPAPFDRRYAEDPYFGEVAYVDSQLGDFLDRLGAAGALEHTLIVLTADHGESLGEHGERTHGVFAYNGTLRVPLILWAGGSLAPAIDSTTVGHVSIVPTILELLGVAVPPTVQGTSLLAMDAGTPGPAVYFESLNGFLAGGLAPLTGAIEGPYKFIDLPIPELYDVRRDPGEQDNLMERRAETAERLAALVVARRETDGDTLLDDSGSGEAASPAGIDEETRRRLQALGYLSATMPPRRREFTADDDPKTNVAAIEKHRTAMALSDDPEQAIRLLRELLRARPGSTAAALDLASILFGAGRPAEAISTLQATSAAHPGNPQVMGRLGFYLAAGGEPARGVVLQEAAVSRLPDQVDLLAQLGVTYGELGRTDEARRMFLRALELDPSSADARYNLGLTYLRDGDFDTAIGHLESSIVQAPDYIPSYDALAGAYAASNRLPAAVDTWKKLLALEPRHFDALYNVGIVLARLERNQEALPYLERFVREAPVERYADDIEAVRAIAAEVRRRIGGETGPTFR